MKKNKLDEMQEQKLLRIEHNGCWLAFWGLFAAICIQGFILQDMKGIMGTWIVFMGLCVYLLVACLKNGIWDRRLEANFTTNAIVSGIAGLAVGIFGFVSSYVRYHKLIGSIAAGVFMFVFTAGACLSLLSISSYAYKKKRERLDDSGEE